MTHDMSERLLAALTPIVADLVERHLARLVAEGKIREIAPDAATLDLDERFGVQPRRVR